MEYFSLTDIGNYREKNEDSLYADSNLFLVADGMGGHKAGEIASKTALEVFTKNFYNQKLNIKNLAPPSITQLMIQCAQFSNREVYRLSEENSQYSGMGTTLTACYISDLTAYVLNVGDSRLYLKKGKEVTLKTYDQTLAGELYKKGEISYDQAFSHPQKNILTQVVGMNSDLKPQSFQLNLNQGDTLLLCTDGLNSMLKDQMIGKIMNKQKTLSAMGQSLVEHAKRQGGYDNITLIIIRI